MPKMCLVMYFRVQSTIRECRITIYRLYRYLRLFQFTTIKSELCDCIENNILYKCIIEKYITFL